MKVVKCLEHIPQELWGEVYNNELKMMSLKLWEYYDKLKPYDFFPLPKVGDKVLVSNDGIKWYMHREDKEIYWRFLAYQKGFTRPFRVELLNDEPNVYRYKYIKPIPVEFYIPQPYDVLIDRLGCKWVVIKVYVKPHDVICDLLHTYYCGKVILREINISETDLVKEPK